MSARLLLDLLRLVRRYLGETAQRHGLPESTFPRAGYARPKAQVLTLSASVFFRMFVPIVLDQARTREIVP